jgi:hypothetical protein
MAIDLGTKEAPVRVNCDVTDHHRWLFVRLNPEQQKIIDALEMREGDRQLYSFADRGSNVNWGEVRLRFPSRGRNLYGCYITAKVNTGAFRYTRGQATLDLWASEVKVVRRPWWTWCI